MKKLMALIVVLMIIFTNTESITYAAAFPNTERDGAVNEDREDREWDWLGLFGLIGLVGLKRNRTIEKE